MSSTRLSYGSYNIHIADGFVDDCNNLIQACLKRAPLTYKKFSTLWKEMNFSTIYQGRSLGSEVAELSEEMIYIAKRYMVGNTRTYEESVAGLFLVYSLLNVQPFSGFAALRLVPEDVPVINRIEIAARRQRRFDVLYILGSLLVKGPCQFHAEHRERGMELQLRKYLEGVTNVDKLGVQPKGVLNQTELFDLMKEMSRVFQLYSECKAKLKPSKQDPSLQYADSSIGTRLQTSLTQTIDGHKGDSSGSEHSNKVHEIKMKAMVNTVNPMKHLTSVAERQSKSLSAKTAPVVNPQKTCSPTESEVSSPPRKKGSANAKENVKSKRRRKRRITKFADSSDEDDEVSAVDINDADLNLEYSAGKEVIPNPIEEEPEFIGGGEQGLNIEIGSLPILIRTDHPDEYIEIEIIDQFKKNEKEKEKCDNTKLRNKLLSRSDVSIEKIKESEPTRETPGSNAENSTEMAKISKITTDDDNTFKKPSGNYQTLKLKKPEKRDQKKPIIKSKFRRMGMLPVANFKESN